MLLEIRTLDVCYRSLSGDHHAVRGVSFWMKRGEIVSLVGESGSGKSTVALSIGRLTDFFSCTVRGEVLVDGSDVLMLDTRGIRDLRRRDVGYVFQEPAASLNPVFKIKDQIAEAIRKESDVTPLDLLRAVHLADPKRVAGSYPHQLSGGMKQRVMIAMALAKEPKLLIADEPTTALDVTTQSQILKLFVELKTLRGLSVLFITHDINVASQISDRILVMRHGKIVERILDTKELKVSDPYAKRLLRAADRNRKPKSYFDL